VAGTATSTGIASSSISAADELLQWTTAATTASLPVRVESQLWLGPFEQQSADDNPWNMLQYEEPVDRPLFQTITRSPRRVVCDPNDRDVVYLLTDIALRRIDLATTNDDGDTRKRNITIALEHFFPRELTSLICDYAFRSGNTYAKPAAALFVIPPPPLLLPSDCFVSFSFFFWCWPVAMYSG
jgi:hypothetical protein